MEDLLQMQFLSFRNFPYCNLIKATEAFLTLIHIYVLTEMQSLFFMHLLLPSAMIKLNNHYRPREGVIYQCSSTQWHVSAADVGQGHMLKTSLHTHGLIFLVGFQELALSMSHVTNIESSFENGMF